MAILKDEEEQKGQGTSQFLGQAQQPAQAQQEEPQQPTQSSATIGSSPSQPATIKGMPKQQKAGTGTFANLRSYLQAAQGGGQQRVAQAATQQIQRLGTGAQKGIQQAQETFGKRMEAGSLANMGTAQQEASDIVKVARGITYQAPQQQPTVQTQSAEASATEQPTPAPQPAQPQQYFTPEQQQRFAEIINARYQGPESLQQAGLYEQAAKKARTAQEAAQLTQTAGGREQLLKDVFGRSRDYSRGTSKLDALLLNASQQGVQQLQEQAKPALTSQQALQEAQNTTANLASQRRASIEGVSSGARQALTGARSEEEKAVEDRINNLISTPAKDEQGNPIQKLDASGKPVLDASGNPTYLTEWERLPEYFRQSMATKDKAQWELSPVEAAILGVSSGEGLYNIRPEDIRTTQAERDRLITKNELSRQLALQQLAGLDTSRQLQKDLLYTDLEKAGTQDLASSLDVDSFRKLLDKSQQKFKESAEGANLTGTGKKKVSRGNWAGKKTKTYYAEQSGNVADMLRQAGYDVSAESPEDTRSLLSDKYLLNRYLGATSTNRDAQGNRGFNTLEGGATGAATGASIGSVIPGVGTAIGAGIGGSLGAMVGGNTIDSTQILSDLAKDLEEKLGIKGLGAVGQGVQDVRSFAGSPLTGIGNALGNNVVGDIFRGVGGAISGINTGEMKKAGESKAKQLAIQDLQKKYENYLKGQGFENRTNIVDTEATRARSQALQDLLRRQG